MQGFENLIYKSTSHKHVIRITTHSSMISKIHNIIKKNNLFITKHPLYGGQYKIIYMQ